MTVDFAFKRAPAYRIASIKWKGPWSDAKIHGQFVKVQKWAKAAGLKTGHWVFMEPASRQWEVGIEVKGPAKPRGGIRLRTLPASRVASVTFDPEVVSPAVIYHGVNDWLRWRRKDKKVRSVGAYREVYEGDPWKDAKAAARVNIQVVVRP
jgi:DNA gyrase inhibitor GyrI